MFFKYRTAFLRLVAMAALVASALLTADHLRPERAFCPLEAACSAARESALGTLMGIPTSMLGMGAFGSLFLLTLLPVEWSRPLLRPAGLLAAVAGLAFIGYQAFVLKTFCPLCLIADTAGFLAGLVTVTWPQPPIRLSGRRLDGEPIPLRLAWTTAATVAVILPFVWPRTGAPSWVEIDPLTTAALALEDEDEAPPPDPASVRADTPAAVPAPESDLFFSHPPMPPAPPRRGHLPIAVRTSVRSPFQTPDRTGPETSTPSPPDATPRRPARAPPRPARPGIVIVEYLNAYCPHCRATHRRLQDVLAASRTPHRVRRIYAWGGPGYPMWVKACAFARTQGLETRMFTELLAAKRDTPAEVFAAARRAGLDERALQRALRDPRAPAWLERDARIMRGAGLRGLPTIDIGRRRLMGEQSTADLQVALDAALSP